MYKHRLSYTIAAFILCACSPSGSGQGKADASLPPTADQTGQAQDPAVLTGNPTTQRKGQVNGVLYQAYHWYSNGNGSLWTQLASQTKDLSDKGITALWLPPAYKGAGGANDVGYGAYDVYDLGEFNQKGSRRTKYGDKDQYLNLIKSAHSVGLDVFADVVMNHKMGADRNESAPAIEVDRNNRNKDIIPAFNIQAWTLFDFGARAGKYSSFTWNWTHFTGVDWDQNRQQRDRIYRFNSPGKTWAPDVSGELGNYDYLMGADIDYNNGEVIQEMKDWGVWYTNFAELDGFRLDAVKHIRSGFVHDWLDEVRLKTQRNLFSVAEYWDFSIDNLLGYLNDVNRGQERLSLFDVPLHLNFHKAGTAQGAYNMATIFQGTLIERAPTRAVTFVDNHDTQALQSLESPVADWFKPMAYALILLRAEAYPSVFAADYNGATYSGSRNGGPNLTIRMPALKETLDLLLAARRDYGYGQQRSYFDDPDLIGWTRAGDDTHKTGMAVVVSDQAAGTKNMELGVAFSGQCFKNLAKPTLPCVTIDADGNGSFPVESKSFAIWVGDRNP